MTRAKLFKNGRSQAVRLPKAFRLKGDSVKIRKSGNDIILSPDEEETGLGDRIFAALEKFTPDFMADGRCQPAEPQVRKGLEEVFP